jgi:hypothetical protein
MGHNPIYVDKAATVPVRADAALAIDAAMPGLNGDAARSAASVKPELDAKFDPLPAVPAIFKQISAWVTYKSAEDKAPIKSGTFENAKSSDPTTQVDYATAIANVQAGRGYANLGFVTDGARTGNLTGVDIDGCRTESNGVVGITAKARAILDFFKTNNISTYIEWTPNLGLRVWFRGDSSKYAQRKFTMYLEPGYKGKAQKVEIFQDGLYFTLTGNKLTGASNEVATLSAEQVDQLYVLLSGLEVAEVQKLRKHKRLVPQVVDGRTIFVEAPPDPAFKSLFDAVGWKPLEDRMNKMVDARFHGLTITDDASIFCPMPGHQPRGVDIPYANLMFGEFNTNEGDSLVHCFGCGFTGDLVSTVKAFDAGEDGGKIEYATMYDCGRAICKEQGLDPDKFFPGTKPSTSTATAATGDPESEEPEEDFKTISVEPYPTSPIFPGPLTDLAKAIYPSLPLEFKMWALMTRWGLMRSGLDSLRFDKHLQGRFYVALAAVPNGGKTGANNESRNSMSQIVDMVNSNYINKTGRPFASVQNLAGIDSGPFLVGEFYEMEKVAQEQATMSGYLDNAAKIMHDPDELSEVFDKGRSTSNHVSTLFKELLKLHTNNRTGNGTRGSGKLAVTKAHLAILGGVPVDEYKALWMGTGSGSSGLMSRFIPIVTNAPPVPPIPLATDGAAAAKAYLRLVELAQMPGQEVAISDEANTMFTDWWGSIDTKGRHAIRVAEIVKQLLLVLAQLNAPKDHIGTTLTIESDLMRFGIDFGKYLIAIRERLNPEDSWSPIQAMENAIIAWMQKNASRTNPMTRNMCRRGIHPQRMPGGLGAFKNGWDNCVNTGVVKIRDQGRKSGRYSL